MIRILPGDPVTASVLFRKSAMMSGHDLHPLARDVVQAFATESYFRSTLLAYTLAERNPTQCVQWAFKLVEHFVASSTPREVVNRTLSAIREAITSLSTNELPRLDELSWRSWCSGAFDQSSPFAQRAVARLGWATMLLICHTAGSHVDSKFTGIHMSAKLHRVLQEMANQCGMAVDMIYAGTDDGRLMVAASFSREMARAS